MPRARRLSVSALHIEELVGGMGDPLQPGDTWAASVPGIVGGPGASSRGHAASVPFVGNPPEDVRGPQEASDYRSKEGADAVQLAGDTPLKQGPAAGKQKRVAAGVFGFGLKIRDRYKQFQDSLLQPG